VSEGPALPVASSETGDSSMLLGMRFEAGSEFIRGVGRGCSCGGGGVVFGNAKSMLRCESEALRIRPKGPGWRRSSGDVIIGCSGEKGLDGEYGLWGEVLVGER
jgi:hypothetical protein